MRDIKACINILSSRTKCLPVSLKSFQEKWNYKYDYPVYVHYFDDIYDDPKLRKAIVEFTGLKDLTFISIPYWSPPELPESEMFYNRKDLWYVNTGRFGPSRKGFLHMNRFFNNLYGYPKTEFEKYDYILSFDDESLFLKEVPYNFFEVMEERPEPCGAIKIVFPHIKPPHQGNFDCRVGMKDFVIDYVNKHNIKTESEFINNLLQNPTEEYFHNNLIVADSWVFKTEVFKSDAWKQWSDAVRESHGIFKYRWGDCELNVLFFLIHYGCLPYDFKTVDEGYHDQGGLRHVQGYAPSIKDFHK